MAVPRLPSVLERRLFGIPARRLATVPGVGAAATGLAASAPVWLPAAATLDALTARTRLPWTRLLSFATAWAWLESAGVAASAALWITGRSGRADLHYTLQRRWAAALVDALRVCAGLRIEVEGADVLAPGPIVMLSRHANLADALVPAWLLGRAGMCPRYVLTSELLVDPCLDIVGNRLPNHFVERGTNDGDGQLAQLRQLARGMGGPDAAVIYPEGRLASAARRTRRLAQIAEQDPARAVRLRGMHHLLAPKIDGAAALLAGAPTADVVFLAHHGLEGLDRLVAAPAVVPFREPVRVRLTRVARSEVPQGAGLARWLDEQWLAMDRWVDGQERPAAR
ncbi:MAG: hypothetical protein FJW88_11625 [Actinobacteria bacterium]|nr:hypothetical protein [Actinomycetota bacterium]